LIKNLPSKNSISACALETEISDILISQMCPRPIFNGALSLVEIT
jgi:hypothetical protein